MLAICWPISPVAFEVCSASAFTSVATTAKPRPASPARAASIVALSARRLVWPAIVLISSTTSPIRAAALESSLTCSLVRRAWLTASPAIRADSCTWRLISVTAPTSSRQSAIGNRDAEIIVGQPPHGGGHAGDAAGHGGVQHEQRSEERRVGKE